MHVFVFGSNLAGRHGKGVALEARTKHGAVYGQGSGLQGRSYAIPTKDGRIGTPKLYHPDATLPLESIRASVRKFITFATEHSTWVFSVTRIGCGLAGYVDAEIAPLFKGAPDNCQLPDGWRDTIKQSNIRGLGKSANIRAGNKFAVKRIRTTQSCSQPSLEHLTFTTRSNIMARGISNVPVPKNDRAPRVDEVLDLFKFPPNQWTTLRFFPVVETEESTGVLGNELIVASHWVETWNEEGNKQKFSKQCLGFDRITAKVTAENCPFCYNLGASPKLDYYYNVIVRDIQNNEPARQPDWTAGETNTWFKERESKSFTPVRIVRLTPTVLTKLQKLQQLKGAKLDDVEKGFDVSIYFDPKAKSAADTYQVQAGDRTPLQDYEWNAEYGCCAYLIHNVGAAYPEPESFERAEAECQRILPNLVAAEEKPEKTPRLGGGRSAAKPADDYGYEGGDMDAGEGASADDEDYAAPAPASKGSKGGKGSRSAPEDDDDLPLAAPAKGGKGARPSAPADDDHFASKPIKGGKGARPAADDFDADVSAAEASFAPAAKGGKGAPAAKGARPAAHSDDDYAAPARPAKGAKGARAQGGF